MDKPEISLSRIQRVYEHTCLSLKKHEDECCVCLYWIKHNEEIRCADYRELQLTRDKWNQLGKMLIWGQSGGAS